MVLIRIYVHAYTKHNPTNIKEIIIDSSTHSTHSFKEFSGFFILFFSSPSYVWLVTSTFMVCFLFSNNLRLIMCVCMDHTQQSRRICTASILCFVDKHFYTLKGMQSIRAMFFYYYITLYTAYISVNITTENTTISG